MPMLHQPEIAEAAIHTTRHVILSIPAWKEWAGRCLVVAVRFGLGLARHVILLVAAFRSRF